MSTSSTVLSAFRRSTANSLRLQAPISKRFFTPSAANMVVKTYFDVNWTGPEVTVDQRGNVTNVGPVKGELPRPAMPCTELRAGAALQHACMLHEALLSQCCTIGERCISH